MIYGIIGAEVDEVEGLKKLITNPVSQTFGTKTFISGKLQGKDVVLTCSGVGKVSASIATTILITVFKVDVVINTGVAGGLSPDTHILDLVVANGTSQHDFDLTFFGRAKGEVPGFTQIIPTDAKFAELAMKKAQIVADKHNFKIHSGVVVSGDQFISSQEVKNKIEETFPSAKATEMEAASISFTSTVLNTPCLILRTISDNATDGACMTFDELLPLATSHSQEILLQILAD